MTEIDYAAFEEFAGTGPKRSERRPPFEKWCSEHERLKTREQISMACALEYLHAMFSYAPLVEDAEQIARRNREVDRAKAKGLGGLEAVAVGNEKFPIELALSRLRSFMQWYFFQKNIYVDPQIRSLPQTVFEKMVKNGVQPLDGVMRAYLVEQPGIDRLIYASDLGERA